MLRIIRIIRAAKLLSTIAKKTAIGNEWVIPERYLAIAPYEARTIAGILRVLTHINARIQDSQLGVVIMAFVKWHELEITGIHRDPFEIYEDTVKQLASKQIDLGLGLVNQKLDSVLLDLIMYNDPKLVGEAMRMLMTHKSQERLLLEATAQIQIITSPKTEAKYREMSQIFLVLQRSAEAFEVWGSLSSSDDETEAQTVLDSLNTLIGLARSITTSHLLDLTSLYYAEVEVQQLLLNLGALPTIVRFQKALCDGNLTRPHPRILAILLKSAELLCWFLWCNGENQIAAFKHMEWFMQTTFFNASTIRAILWKNKALVKECPRKFITGDIRIMYFIFNTYINHLYLY